MSSEVNETIEINAPPQKVWDLVMDPARLGEWVSAHRSVKDAPSPPLTEGTSFTQTLRLAGKSFEVCWTLVEADEPKLAVWSAEGPVSTKADVRYELSESNGGTRFDYWNSFSLPRGPLKLVGSRISGPPARHAARSSLAALKRILES